MSTSSAVSAQSRTHHTAAARITRAAQTTVAVTAFLFSATHAAVAQTTSQATSQTTSQTTRQTTTQAAAQAMVPGVATASVKEGAATSAQQSAPSTSAWEFRVTSGAFVPTGTQRNFLKDAQVTAAQLSWVVRPSLAFTGTFGWARSRDRRAADTPKLDAFTSDIGVEVRPSPLFSGRKLTFSPFVGAGAGARSYNYRNLHVDATNNVAGYGTAGGEVGAGRVGVRLEVRDYATGFKPLVGAGKTEARNDLMLMVGVRFNRQHAVQH